jgi:hypothetical protein
MTAPTTDRTKAANYVTNMLSPGDHFSSKDLALQIDRKKSETLRVINWLIDQGYIKKIGSGPSTSYLVLDTARPLSTLDVAKSLNDLLPEDQKLTFGESVTASIKPIQKEIASLHRQVSPPLLISDLHKAQEKRSNQLFHLEKLIEDELEIVQERISFLTHAYEKEPMFRNDYLLQFLYGKLELLEKLME